MSDAESQPVIQKPLKKLYYSISQAAEMVELAPLELKRWEKYFPQIRPVRNRADNRYYTERDIYLLLYIKDLLYHRKLEIPEAQQALDEYWPQIAASENLQLKQVLAEVKLEVQEILTLLSSGAA